MRNTLPDRVRLGIFEVDLRAGELRSGDQRVVLPGQIFQILLMLLERGSEIVTRDEIQKRLWPNDTVVEFDHSINAAIKRLRAALGDSADQPSYIETVGRRGYRLLKPVEPVSAEDVAGPNPVTPVHEQSVMPVGGFDDGGSGTAEGAVLSGRTVSHYRVLEVVGGGGMGVVYRAEDLKLGRQVALKFLPEEAGSDPEAMERFSREARAASSLDHPNICPIHEFGEHEGQPFIVMPLLKGQTLRDRLAALATRKETLATDALLDIAVQIAQGLQAAHERGILHRDVKPANLFITDQGVVKILDFGLAKILELGDEGAHPQAPGVHSLTHAGSTDSKDVARALAASALASPHLGITSKMGPDKSEAPVEDGGGTSAKAAAALTRTGIKMGTAGYMSPEQVRGEPLDARSDIFSFGLILYEMATGERAFIGETVAVLHDSIQHREPRPIHELAADIPPKLEVVITRCLEKEPRQRYQTMREVSNELREVDEAQAPAQQVEKAGTTNYLRASLRVGAVILTIAIAAIVSTVMYRRMHHRPILASKHTLVVADLENKTGDKAFDKSLGFALGSALSQAPTVNLLSTSKVLKSRSALEIPAGATLSPDRARQVCMQTHSDAVIAGAISDAGNGYRIDLQATDCSTGEILASSRVDTADREQVVHDLGVAAHELRERLGEPGNFLQEFNQPLDVALSPSIEALNLLAENAQGGGSPERIPALKRAVELDPKFALAHYDLGQAYFDVMQNRLALVEYKAAYDLRQRAGKYVQLVIEKGYFTTTGQLDLAVASLNKQREFYPQSQPANDLSLLHRYLGRYEDARREAERAVLETPMAAFPYINLSCAYMGLGRLDEAQHVLEEAKAHGQESRWLAYLRYYAAFLRRDTSAMQIELDNAKGHPGTEDLVLSQQAVTETYYGHYREARQLTQTAATSAANGEGIMSGFYISTQALLDAQVGYDSSAIQMAEDALKASPQPETKKMAALALAASGEKQMASQLAAELDRDGPVDTLTQRYHLPLIRAAMYMRDQNPQKAIEVLNPTLPYELGGTDPAYLLPAYLRGLAYLQAGDGRHAVVEFQKLEDHPGVVLNYVWGALAHLQLARAHALLGEQEAAQKSYEEFLALWKDADPDIPIYRQAKAEFAKLQ